MSRFSNKQKTSLKVKNSRHFLKGLLLSSLWVAILMGPDWDREDDSLVFYFYATEDHLYENPANWSPYYPGTVIDPDQYIHLQETAYFNGFNLEVNGVIEVMAGTSLFSASHNLQVNAQGKIYNYGEIITEKVENKGVVLNQMNARIHVRNLENGPSAILDNNMTSECVVLEELINEGKIKNASYCSVAQLRNCSEFVNLRGSELWVKGNRIQTPDQDCGTL